MRKGLMTAAAAVSLTFQSAIACDIHGKTGIVEKNDLWIGPDAKSVSTVTEEKFNEALDRIEEIYAPIIEARGKRLDMIRKWDDGTVNAYAQQTGNTWKVSMFGGLARHEAITQDGFALVACHEVGHHLGGVPKKRSWWSSSWASNEGQADYFGTSKCFRKYMEKDDNVAMMANVKVPEFAIQECTKKFSNAEDLAMCKRGAMAGMSLAGLFKALRNLEEDLRFDQPDTNVVSKTDDNHPAPQCRLDTYFAGSLCDKNHYDDVSDRDADLNVCVRSDGYTLAARPKCWYKRVARN